MSWNPLLRRAAALGATGFAIVTLLVGITEGAPVTFLVADTTLGLLFIGAGVVAWERRPEVRSGPLLVASGVLWFVGSYSPTSLVPASVLGFAFERYYDLVLPLLVLTFPRATLGRPGRLVLAILGAALVVRTVGRLLIDCDCITNPFAVVPDPVLFERVELIAGSTILACSLAVAVLAWQRLRGAGAALRRVLGPVVAAGVVAALSAVYDTLDVIVFITTRQPLINLPEPWAEVAGWLPFVAVALVPFGFLAGSLRLRRRHGVIAPLAVELDRGADPGQLEVALRHALGDPSVELVLWDRDRGRWLDAAGRKAEEPAEGETRAVTMLERDGAPIAAVVHDPALREDPGLVAAATAVLRLAVENERLAGDVRRQLDEVRASRARLVEAAHAERRRIELDLHDGAQQRLVSVALMLQEARDEARRREPHGKVVHRLDETADELVAAIDDLRELARGIHPAVLTEEGLGVAVASLARRAPLPVDVDVALDTRLPPAVEATGYYVVAEALTNVARHARARTAAVSIALRDGALEVEVADDGDGGTDVSRGTGLRGLADRLDAISGRLEVSSPPNGGTRVKATIPCA